MTRHDAANEGSSGATGPTEGPFLVAASLSGEADAEWARAAAPYVDYAILGGVALDPASRAAARDLVARERSEFLPDDPLAFMERQLSALDEFDGGPVGGGFNVRSATVDPVREAAAVCAAHDTVCEINAHCRQPELRAVGCGESLLREPDRLADYVAAASGTGATTSVKVRTEVPGVDLPEVARLVAATGADWLHVDAMDSEGVVAEVADVVADADALVVANNGVRDEATVREYLAYGADAVSVGRPSDDPRVLSRVANAVREWEEVVPS